MLLGLEFRFFLLKLRKIGNSNLKRISLKLHKGPSIYFNTATLSMRTGFFVCSVTETVTHKRQLKSFSIETIGSNTLRSQTFSVAGHISLHCGSFNALIDQVIHLNGTFENVPCISVCAGQVKDPTCGVKV
jgi:hypothetical protein